MWNKFVGHEIFPNTKLNLYGKHQPSSELFHANNHQYTQCKVTGPIYH